MNDVRRSREGEPFFAEAFADLPVDRDDGLLFEFEGLARTLAQLALNPRNRTPFTAAVRGGWGRGKTSLLRAVRRRLESPKGRTGQERQVRTLWCNAWKYPDEGTVLAGLLGALLDEMRRSEGFLDALKTYVSERKGRIAAAILKTAAPWLVDLIEPDDRYKELSDERAFYDSFRTTFFELWYAWGGERFDFLKDTQGRDIEEELRTRQDKTVLAVFLDDLDRCREERVLDVLSAINLFLDLPGVCFYLGVDWERLTEILATKMSAERADGFLEKIVQVSLPLPAVNEEGVESYAGRLLHATTLAKRLDLMGGQAGQPNALGAFAAVARSRHPRHVKRFLNDLSIAFATLANTGKLADGDATRLPPRALLAFHLLLESLDIERREELRALAVNVQGYLRRWREPAPAETMAADGPAPAGTPAADAVNAAERRARHPLLEPYVQCLAGLNEAQLDLLVHFGSPPQDRAVHTRPSQGGAAAGEIEWVRLEGGSLRMGAPDIPHATPEHEVTLSPFAISRYPVTNVQYRELVRAAGFAAPEHWRDGEVPEGLHRHPVVNVRWKDAEAYCTWLGKALDRDVRLPTEAQWEFAARGTTGRRYPWGDEEPAERHANYDNPERGTTAVDDYPGGATPEGMMDLAGNVWEWCSDWFGDYPRTCKPDYEGPRKGHDRVLRGGSFVDGADALRAAARAAASARRAGANLVGFRVVWCLPREPIDP